MEQEPHISYPNLCSIAVSFMYHPSAVSSDLSKTSALMIANLEAENAADTFERGVVATLSFFVGRNFQIANNLADFDPNLRPQIPNNWRGQVLTKNAHNGKLAKMATFYVKLRDQQFTLSCSHQNIDSTVVVSLYHLEHRRAFGTVFNNIEVDEMATDNGLAFANLIADRLYVEFKHPIQKASMNKGPSSIASPS